MSNERRAGCQSVYDANGIEVFQGEWNPKALFSALSGDDTSYWQDRTVLDIGANTAGLSLEIARHGAKVTAAEPDPYSNSRAVTLELVNSMATAEGLSLDLVRKGLFEAHTLGPFDTVLCLGLIYHFREPQYCIDYLSTLETKDLFISTQTDPGEGYHLVNRKSPGVVPPDFLGDEIILTGWHPTRGLFERMLRWGGFDEVTALTDPTLNFPKKPPGLTNSSYYRAVKRETVDPKQSRETYMPR